MSLLLDTNVLLWWLYRADRLTRHAREAISDPSSLVYVSAVCGWEIAIKLSLGRLKTPPNVNAWLPGALLAHRFQPLSIEMRHVLPIEHLPPHHTDPFDRLLIAQANADGLTIVTGDRQFANYAVPVIPCW